ncbi:hypothetical protein COCON_G00002820 [Conger conger]|uniref:Ig-like domain-containing protein n=1 Tax=Conger conger TaxID=82655 RepID=A0A9Q1I8E5_CONCO|nr:hypothetical protein COCON_G00002820 [Conger conger]
MLFKTILVILLYVSAFTWYRDGSPLSFTTQTHQLTASSEDGGRYSCAVKGYEDLPSPVVALTVN